MVSVASGLLGAANVNLLAHIAINLELPDWRQLKAHHWARMELSDLATARTYARELLDLEAGAPGAPGLAATRPGITTQYKVLHGNTLFENARIPGSVLPSTISLTPIQKKHVPTCF